MRRSRPRTPGFTLIELMIVTAIICILAAILFPVFAKAREKARQTNCARNLKELGLALRLYAYDACSHFPPTDDDFQPLRPYLPDWEVLVCPTARIAAKDRSGTQSYRIRGGLTSDGLPMTEVAHDSDRAVHNNGANHLFLDGHVKWMKSNVDLTPDGTGGSGS